MSDEDALLGAIWDAPNDDTPRLVYADWLDENSDPESAEFIRVQCELARYDKWDDAREPLARREARLWKRNKAAWQKHLPRALRTAAFRRGFVSPPPQRISTEQFRSLTTGMLAAAPAWDYEIAGDARGMSALARCPHLLRVGALKFWTVTSRTAANNLLGSKYLRNVRSLMLGVGNEWCRALPVLAANADATSLVELDTYDGFGDAAAAVVSGSPAFGNLRTLRTSHHDLSPAGVASIFNSRHLTALTELTLPTWYGDEGVAAIAASRPVFALRTLNLYGAWTSDAAAAQVANWPGLESVRDLTIGGHTELLGPRALAASPYARNLRRLDLTLSNLDRAGALARSKTLDLRVLEIKTTPAADDETAVTALMRRFGKDALKLRYPGQRKKG
ncbi:Repeat-companion domain TIGR02996 OS=Singulisphaera acidiphila (strain ATCC BAA-1392 / DSM 18658 / VKM B-2454 / MOB10) GN=Sinac_4455 PE=4 SV=1 [Gemmataceae bacterium]|nr:Repeat-companion domain TIGR02996 OS=Singulisphaera acidiphila (strain ATCC BAA-1392 / DSM 18658 / VKM B-2454 / MOB10) GN=Sinac_4455 PE=4 SV=1 [Gemmataceae bacterium]VTU00197.1 Repeat-companion domain TIGR02996 OS=Singulisphaera acidiphila (strain ATCC BAA-1392 / DSM 18658 / VKM B-2454 / MOB10) GN=Sinac_4455 PE=4 SV=1 [Gemmataceae bacterium]